MLIPVPYPDTHDKLLAASRKEERLRTPCPDCGGVLLLKNWMVERGLVLPEGGSHFISLPGLKIPLVPMLVPMHGHGRFRVTNHHSTVTFPINKLDFCQWRRAFIPKGDTG